MNSYLHVCCDNSDILSVDLIIKINELIYSFFISSTYNVHSVSSRSLSCCSEANYTPPIIHSQDLTFWYSSLIQTPVSWIMLFHYIVIKHINDICCIYVGSLLLTLRVLSLLSLLLPMLGCMDGQRDLPNPNCIVNHLWL